MTILPKSKQRLREGDMDGAVVDMREGIGDPSSFWHFNIGHVVSIAFLLIAVIGSWTAFHEKLAVTVDRLDAMKIEQVHTVDLVVKVDGLNSRMSFIEHQDLPTRVDLADRQIGTITQQLTDLMTSLDRSQKARDSWQEKIDNKLDMLTGLMAKIEAREELRMPQKR